MIKDYSDIIDLERPVSRFPKMSRQARAAQFAPFAALTGYEDAVKEASRFVGEKPLLDDQEIERINQTLRDAIEFDDAVDLIVFEPDSHKSGGRVGRVTSRIKKIDETERKLVLENGRQIILENIVGIKTEDSSLDQVPW